MEKCFAAKSRNNCIREKSSSGGVFFELSKYIIENSGVVYGVSMDCSNRFAEYMRVDRLEDLDRLLGSKYMQAKIGDTFPSVKRDLENGTLVLFTGTGCIINGLKFFLNHHYSNLFCIDLICHGVPSPLLWEKYLEYIEKKRGTGIQTVNFRSKKSGWESFSVSLTDNRGKQLFLPVQFDFYMQSFLRNISLRPSCFECMAKTIRMADVTLGDFWGINKVAPEMNDDKGVSLIIIRTESGNLLINKIIDKLQIKEVAFQDAIQDNSAAVLSVDRPDRRDDFFRDLPLMSISQLEEKYINRSLKQKIKKYLFEIPFVRQAIMNKRRRSISDKYE